MVRFVWRPGVALVALIACLSLASEGRAESIQKQCSVKYRAAKTANSLNGESWNQFYKQCAAELKGAPAAAPASSAAPSTPPPATEATAPEKHRRKKEEKTSAPSTPAPMASGPVVFPTGISTKYSSQTPAKQRFHTCLDQYHANKASNSNGGLRWIEKGDGYYSECNKRLKGG